MPYEAAKDDEPMANANTFSVSVVTPEEAVVERDDASMVIVPAHDGEIGIMRGHAPILLRLGIGALRVEVADGEKLTYYVDGGFAQVVDNRLTVLTEQAKDPAELDAAAAAEAWERIRGESVSDERAARRHQDAMQRAQVQKRMARAAQ